VWRGGRHRIGYILRELRVGRTRVRGAGECGEKQPTGGGTFNPSHEKVALYP